MHMSLHYGHINNPVEHLKRPDFEINMTRAYNNPDTLFHKVGINDNRAMIIRDNDSWLHQDDYNKCPSLIRERDGECYITSEKNISARPRILFHCPELTQPDVSVFIVLKSSFPQLTGNWGYIIGNDNGGYDKFIGYTTGSTKTLSYGGGLPPKEYKCTIPDEVDVSNKHLISCHWLMSGSHLRVNNIKCVGSEFIANPKYTGAQFASLFYNERFVDNSAYKPFMGRVYGLRVVKGFLKSKDIDEIGADMMFKHNVREK